MCFLETVPRATHVFSVCVAGRGGAEEAWSRAQRKDTIPRPLKGVLRNAGTHAAKRFCYSGMDSTGGACAL